MVSRQNHPGVAVEEIIDRLYGLPLGEFTRARDQAASELRGEGRREEADQVKALRKPTVAAAAVNRLVRDHRAEVEGFLRAAEALRDAQLAGKGDVVEATRREREALRSLVRSGGDAVRQTLLAAAADSAAAEELRQGRLHRELEPAGFTALLSQVQVAAPRPAAARKKSASAAKQRPDDSAARAELQRAKTALTVARNEEIQARRAWEQSKRSLDEAQAAADDARRELERLRAP
jgi:hypothetical protein